MDTTPYYSLHLNKGTKIVMKSEVGKLRLQLAVTTFLLLMSLWYHGAGLLDIGVNDTTAIATMSVVPSAPVARVATFDEPSKVIKPVDFSHPNGMRDKAYIERFQKVAIAEMEKNKVLASITMAQGILESASGTSRLSVKSNNHFGIKCFSKKCSSGHCTNFDDDHHKDYFVNFRNAWESYRSHSNVLKKERYAKLYSYGDDYKKWAHGLKAAGYATDKRYAYKIIDIIERYQLQRLDVGILVVN